MEELEWLFKSSNLPDRAAKYNTVKAALSANGGEAVAWSRPSNPSNGGAVFTADPVVAECWKREGKTVTPLYPAPPSVAVPEPVHELISGIRSINRAAHHLVRVTGDDEPCYYQRDEWIKWVLELADKAENAVSAPSPDHSGDANKMVAMLREIVDMWDGPRYSLQMKPLIDRARTLIAGYEATPSVPENEIKARALEEYADQLDAVFANAQEAGATDCPAWHAGQFAKDARKQAARLRTAGDEGEGV